MSQSRVRRLVAGACFGVAAIGAAMIPSVSHADQVDDWSATFSWLETWSNVNDAQCTHTAVGQISVRQLTSGSPAHIGWYRIKNTSNGNTALFSPNTLSDNGVAVVNSVVAGTHMLQGHKGSGSSGVGVGYTGRYRCPN